MPANANIKLAIEAALRAANNGFQSMDGSDPFFDQAMTAAAASKHMGGTIIKAHKDGDGDAFWFVPVRSDVVTKSGASEHKIAIVQSGNDGNGTATKLSELLAGEWLVTHAVRAVLTSPQGVAGARASLSVAGIPATLTPKAGAQLTHLVLSVGGVESELSVEAALKAVGLTFSPWRGCSAKEALTPVGDGMPALADARAKAATLTGIAGIDNFKAQAATQALGIASAAFPNTVGNVAAIVAGWAGYPDSADAMTIVLAIVNTPTARCTQAKTAAAALFAALRKELAALTSDQMADVAKLSAQLVDIGITPEGMHIGTWLQGLAATATATRQWGVAPAMPQAPPGLTTAVVACEAEAKKRVAAIDGLTDATKATMVSALTAQLLGEGWGAAAAAVATVGLDPMRISGAERLPPTQVFAEIAKAINKTVPEVMASISMARGSSADDGSAMFLSEERVAERGAEDLRFMAEQSGTVFEAQPKSWDEAASRIGEIMTAFARTRKVADGGRSTESASAKLARRLSTVDSEQRDVKKIYDAKGVAKGTSTAATILDPLTTDSFARKEAMAKKEDDEFKEVHRLCSHEGAEGRGCESHILSDGKSVGSMANKGEVPPSIVGARENLASLIEDTTERFMGESLVGEAAGDEVAHLATSIVTANISTKPVVRLFGARKDTKSTVGGRTVMSGARFGSMTGARHARARVHNRPPTAPARERTQPCEARAHMPAEGAVARGWVATAAAHRVRSDAKPRARIRVS